MTFTENKAYRLLFLFILFCLSGSKIMAEEPMRFENIHDVSADQWEKLAKQNIYFGHQSVGFNILNGINDILRENPQIRLNIIETDRIENKEGGVFAHSRIGQNTKSGSKMNDFARVIVQNNPGRFDTAFMKLCYVDVVDQTDVPELFKEYKQTVAQLKQDLPQLNIIHFTVPLTTTKTSWKTKVKILIGKKPWELADNIKRNEFNELLRKEYSGKDPVFDLAAYEAADLAGNKASFTYKGKKYHSMRPEYTHDGGHLNEKGRRVIAEQLLVFLAKNM